MIDLYHPLLTVTFHKFLNELNKVLNFQTKILGVKSVYTNMIMEYQNFLISICKMLDLWDFMKKLTQKF